MCYPVFPIGMCPEVPSFPFKQIRNRFKFLSLLTSKEAIDALNHVRTECGRVVSMHLFHHSGVTKHLKLEEFQLAQSQATIQVCVCVCVCLYVYSRALTRFNVLLCNIDKFFVFSTFHVEMRYRFHCALTRFRPI